MTITPETIAELRWLLSPLTTPRPWHVCDRGIGWEIHEGTDAECLSEYGVNSEGCEPINNGLRDTFSLADAELIADAVNALPALLDAVERLAVVEAERDALAASVARVRELHVMHPDDCKCLERMFGGECFHHGGCEACRCKFPCSTLAALDGSGS